MCQMIFMGPGKDGGELWAPDCPNARAFAASLGVPLRLADNLADSRVMNAKAFTSLSVEEQEALIARGNQIVNEREMPEPVKQTRVDKL